MPAGKLSSVVRRWVVVEEPRIGRTPPPLNKRSPPGMPLDSPRRRGDGPTVIVPAGTWRTCPADVAGGDAHYASRKPLVAHAHVTRPRGDRDGGPVALAGPEGATGIDPHYGARVPSGAPLLSMGFQRLERRRTPDSERTSDQN